MILLMRGGRSACEASSKCAVDAVVMMKMMMLRHGRQRHARRKWWHRRRRRRFSLQICGVDGGDFVEDVVKLMSFLFGARFRGGDELLEWRRFVHLQHFQALLLFGLLHFLRLRSDHDFLERFEGKILFFSIGQKSRSAFVD